jgi:predicted nucleotidyltransferase component of viral defense system
MEFRNLDQEKSFMKKEAKRLGITPMATYTTYYARKLLEKLALINNGDLVVKGSFSQYVHLKELTRPVLDIDLSSTLSHHIPINILFAAIYDTFSNELTFDLSTTPRQTKNGVYKIPVVAKVKYEDAKEMVIPVPIDFKDNNKVIFETLFKAVEPLFEGDQKFYINTPSFEEHIAEKLYIIAHNTREDIPNTRVKDFYDIYKLFGKNYDEDKFSLYFEAMVMMYGMNLDDINADFLDKEFVKRHLELWEMIKEKYQFVDKEVELSEAVFFTKAVLSEQIQKIRTGELKKQAYSLVRKKGKI